MEKNCAYADDLWYDIMMKYIPDDYTVVKCVERRGVYILAVYLEERNDIEIYTGNSYCHVFSVSGYMDGLLQLIKEDEREDVGYSFTDEEWELLESLARR